MLYSWNTSTSKELAAMTAILPQGSQARTQILHRAFTPAPKVTVKIKEGIRSHYQLQVK